MRDTYTPQDINPPADGGEPDADETVEPDCAECGAPADEAHRKGCPEYVMTEDEYEEQVKRDWRRHVGREPRYLPYGGRR
jgi:hypothetical protein